MNEIPLTIETAGPWLANVLDQFPDERIEPGQVEDLAGDALDGAYRELLFHSHHMTVTLEERCGQPVFLEVLNIRHEGDSYARKLILLSLIHI